MALPVPTWSDIGCIDNTEERKESCSCNELVGEPAWYGDGTEWPAMYLRHAGAVCRGGTI